MQCLSIQYGRKIYKKFNCVEHFNLPGHSLNDLTVTILEQVKVNDQMYREEREHFLIRQFNTYYNGVNRLK